jgi:hypothetical protein
VSSFRCPDLNPIDQCFAKLKAQLRKAGERSVPALWDRIGTAPPNLHPEECKNYFTHVGYGSKLTGICSNYKASCSAVAVSRLVASNSSLAASGSGADRALRPVLVTVGQYLFETVSAGLFRGAKPV